MVEKLVKYGFKNYKKDDFMNYLIPLILLLVTLFGCMPDEFTQKLPSQKIELKSYLGTWYEIARFPNWFEKDLVGVTATYSLKENHKIKVFNQGYIGTLSGEKKVAIGEAWLPDPQNTGRLKVSFFGPFSADYIVLDIDEGYSYALVGSSKDYLWILSRTPQLNAEIYQKLVLKAKTLGFDVSKLERVSQP